MPPVPTPHDGTATRNAAARSVERFDIDVAARKLQPEMVVVVLEALETPIILRSDAVVAEFEPHL